MRGGTRFEGVCSDHNILLRIASFLAATDRCHLRLASQQLRASSNAAVKTAVLKPGSPSWACCDLDLAHRFPNAFGFKVDFSWAGSPGMLTIVLHHLVDACPVFLQRLVRLELGLGYGTITDDDAGEAHQDVVRLLRQCTSLQELKISIDHNCEMITHFKGQGATPEQRQGHMQQQLAAICASSALLTPASWPAGHCLEDLLVTVGTSAGAEYERGLARAVVQTVSLKRLRLQDCTAPALAAWQGISALSQLTSLCIEGITGISDASTLQRQEFAATVAELTSLADLSFEPLLLAESDTAGVFTIPRCWSRLSRLTWLQLDFTPPGTVRVEHAACLPALQQLHLHQSRVHCLANLFALTALTSVVCTANEEEHELLHTGGMLTVPLPGVPDEVAAQLDAEGVVAPQQWKDGMWELAWTYTRQDMRVILQLTSLTSLELLGAVLTPRLSCSLARLPRLGHLKLTLASACNTQQHHFHFPPCATPLRPAFKALQEFACDSDAAASMLASWTDAPAANLSFKGYGSVIPVQSWAPAWLTAALSDSACLQTATFELRTFAAVGALIPAVINAQRAAAGATAVHSTGPCPEPPAVKVLLGPYLEDAAFAALFKGSDGHPCQLHIVSPSKPQPNPIRDSSALLHSPKPSHYSKLAGVSAPHVRVLHIDYCGDGMGPAEFAALVTAVPNLTELVLTRVPTATDAMVCLLAACPKLEVVRLGAASHRCARVTHASVVMLLTVLRHLKHLEVHGVDQASVTGRMPGHLGVRWKVSGTQAVVVVKR